MEGCYPEEIFLVVGQKILSSVLLILFFLSLDENRRQAKAEYNTFPFPLVLNHRQADHLTGIIEKGARSLEGGQR